MRQPRHSLDTITMTAGFHVDAHGTEVAPAPTVRTNISDVCSNPFVWGNLVSLLCPVTSPLVVDSSVYLGLGCGGLALGVLGVRTNELLVPCKLLDT
jgi:hypothetical protein